MTTPYRRPTAINPFPGVMSDCTMTDGTHAPATPGNDMCRPCQAYRMAAELLEQLGEAAMIEQFGRRPS